jgi:hypothetical protein
MIENWETGLLIFVRTVSQILTAGVAVTALSLLLYALTFNLRDRMARTFALILSCVVIVFTAEAIGGVADNPILIDLWLRIEWAGIIFLPPTYMHFSDALLTTTGKPSRGRRKFVTRLSYIISLLFFIGLPFPVLFETIIQNRQPGAYLLPRHNLSIFSLFYLLVMVITWYNFARSYLRTTTPTSRRRMGYLVIGALAPAFGSFPYMIFGSGFAERHQLFFWILAATSNTLVVGLIVLMAYAVAFFGVPWSDRMVKNRLFKWLIRGPATASITLGLVTIVRRMGESYGDNYSVYVPITMVATILLCQYLVTLFSPLWEKWLFFGKDRENLDLLHIVENGILTADDIRQYIELILAAVCDRLQTAGAYAAVLEGGKLELVVTIGKNRFEDIDAQDELQDLVLEKDEFPELFRWGDDCLVALVNGDGEKELLGLLGISNLNPQEMEKDQIKALSLLSRRVSLALRDRRAQQSAFQSLQTIETDVAFIRQVRAAGQNNKTNLLMSEESFTSDNVAQWVRDALSHYWGGPRFTKSPLMSLQIVRDSLEEHEGSTTRALRAVLRDAIEKIRPEGERRFTGEWILYNILEMKFLEGKKVRDIAMRLAMSEADLYRKQRVAIETIGHTIIKMEAQAQDQDIGSSTK